MTNLIETAREYRRLGLAVVAVDHNKKSMYHWREFQSRLMSDHDMRNNFCHPKATGIAIICGCISGNLEVIDIDSKYDLSGAMFRQYLENVDCVLPCLLDKLVIASTRNRGFHIFFRSQVKERNLILARRPASAEEIK